MPSTNCVLKTAIFLLLFSITSSCSEPVPQQHHNSIKFETKERSQSSLDSRIFGNWSNAEVLARDSITDLFFGGASGPNTQLTNNGDNFVSWSVYDKSHNVSTIHSSVYSKREPDAWVSNSPFPLASDGLEESLEIEINKITGEAIAAWVNADVVFSNIYSPSIGWGQPTNHGPGQRIQLSKIANGKVLLLFYSINPSSPTIIATAYDFLADWSQLYSLPYNFEPFFLVAAPVMLNDGSYLFAWHEKINGVDTLFSARFDSLLGWSKSLEITNALSPSNSSKSSIRQVELIADSNSDGAKLIFLKGYGAPDFGIYALDYQLVDGAEETWVRPLTLLNPDSASNHSEFMDFEVVKLNSVTGDLAILWQTDVTDNVNQYHALQLSVFSVETGWSTPNIISTPLFRYSLAAQPTGFIPNFIHSIRLARGSEGRLHAAWVESSDNVNQLKTASMNINKIWGAPEIVAIEPSSNGLIDYIDLSANDSNRARIVWIREISNNLSIKYVLESSELETSPSSQPLPFDPTLPKSANHITSSDICVACHIPSGITIVDHFEVIGACMDCHNNMIAMGQPPQHITTSGVCDSCHVTMAFSPVIIVDHNEIIGTCLECHDNLNASGKPLNHIPSTDICNACHSIIAWTQINFDHMQAIGACVDCHVATASHQAVNIIDACENCHDTMTWLNPTNPFPVLSQELLFSNTHF